MGSVKKIKKYKIKKIECGCVYVNKGTLVIINIKDFA